MLGTLGVCDLPYKSKRHPRAGTIHTFFFWASKQCGTRDTMPRFTRPHLRVEQPKSVFADGNSRWWVACELATRTIAETDEVCYRTNKDLDPVPRHARKWGVTSFLAYWISDAFKYAVPTACCCMYHLTDF